MVPSRTVQVYTAASGLKPIDSTASNLAELISEMHENGIDFNSDTQKAVIANGPMKDHTLEMMTAELPRGSFIMTVVQKEGKGGLDIPEPGTPNERNQVVKAIGDLIRESESQEAADHFNAGKVYHRKKLEELRTLVQQWENGSSQVEDGVTGTVSTEGIVELRPDEETVIAHVQRISSQLKDVKASKNLPKAKELRS